MTVDGPSSDDRAIWRSIRKELEEIGINAKAVEDNHDFIFAWFQNAVDTGAFEEQNNSDAEGHAMTEFEVSPNLSRSPRAPTQRGRRNHDMPQETFHQVKYHSSSQFSSAKTPESRVPSTQTENRQVDRAKKKMNSQVAVLIAAATRPKARLLGYAKSGDTTSELLQVLGGLIDQQTLDLALLNPSQFSDNTEMVVALLRNGANVNAVDTRDNDDGPNSLSALLFAVRRNQERMVQSLLHWGADINYSTVSASYSSDTKTPVYTALELGYIAIVKILVSTGAALFGSRNTATPFHVSCKLGGLEECQLLLERNQNPQHLLLVEHSPNDSTRVRKYQTGGPTSRGRCRCQC